MILSDERITEFGELGMLRPFDASYVRPASYDVRLGDTIDFLTHGRSDPFTIGHLNQPDTTLGIYTPTGTCRLLEMEHTLLYLYLHGIFGYWSKSGLRFSKNALPPSCASSRK